ncbi:MAG: glycerol-3-phosphate 1-O-acyltransferase PlsY [Magnetococcales bacterium]|nr:glycerol-3-phosphate 1-O-acyltransferase PlsY [Magnetococcales bacterium]MBF0150619.1 glycerol-3-phosphate 1-O-acyltransferase PlsY [Magnetococcales bacterium]MBF0629365.1 glycerol-3-phosphate 1-O-acyltransferase PlsY [Magnetococcales bacterium]
MNIWPHGLLVTGAYLLGSIPFGLLMGWLFGSGDIRKQGSGNIGATNVLRTAGKKAAFLALLLDMAKGGVAVAVGIHGFAQVPWLTPALALAAFVGHLYPVYLGFKGGKGVATALGIVLVWTPWVGLLALLTWLLVAVVTRISSLAALVAFMILPGLEYFLGNNEALLVSLIMMPIIFWRHRENILRLLQGTEPRIGKKGSAS